MNGTRALPAVLLCFLGGLGVAAGCQNVSGLSSLEVGTGGGTGGSVPCGYDAGTCDTSCVGGCVGNTCTPTCDKSVCPNQTILTTRGPTAMQCPDTGCAGLTFTCVGASLCELDCKAFGSCANTTLVCGAGPCRMRCEVGMACVDSTMQCGENSCDAVYLAPSTVPAPVKQIDCPQTCGGCTHTDNTM